MITRWGFGLAIPTGCAYITGNTTTRLWMRSLAVVSYFALFTVYAWSPLAGICSWVAVTAVLIHFSRS